MYVFAKVFDIRFIERKKKLALWTFSKNSKNVANNNNVGFFCSWLFSKLLPRKRTATTTTTIATISIDDDRYARLME
jgi:hypothetical protein